MFCGLLLAGCNDPGPSAGDTPSLCRSDATPISVIQGDTWKSPLLGEATTIRGIVTRVEANEGLYLEDPGAQSQPGSSKAMFVSDGLLSRQVQTGQELAVSGRIAELGSKRDTLTSLKDISLHETCSNQHNLPLTRIDLPLDPYQREALEAMRVSLDQELAITDVYNLSRGELTLSSSQVLRVPTEIREPGKAATDLEKENRENAVIAALPGPADIPYPVGSRIDAVSGLLGHDGDRQQLLLDANPPFVIPESAPLDSRSKGIVRVVGSNLLNFFNGDGKGHGFPTERGAKKLDEFIAQSERTRAAFTRMQPDLLAVQELENDGFGPLSSAQSLLDVLNQTGNNDWAFIKPQSSRIGGDVITVGLFYRLQELEAIGHAAILDGPEFVRLSRQPLAQLFRHRASGEPFLVVVHHLKSKGRCPDDGDNADQKDGQGCWNAARVAAVRAQTAWLSGLAAEAGTDKILILGDMNAWRMEDPIREFKEAGYLELVELFSGLPQHSFLYWGATGTLDYAFASPALARFAVAAMIWNINASRPQYMKQPEPWFRMSDHDPVVVDLDFSQSATLD